MYPRSSDNELVRAIIENNFDLLNTKVNNITKTPFYDSSIMYFFIF